ncbi:hypothetical protein PF010_g22379 [Phytophthora fragariae]|nr:hypothetical protein PF009_g16536 [Phytophthora fragariae]KAE9080440.1 hypothetical protein PF010_g22379 [Phytophthora fragariae]KAE9096073.1 hypothetical protein PF007_g17148 [Phytophthora fragariae]KAE9106517.1 hypothetical protein PF006_g21349 [Phytophthora fragariae]KAE9217835.1 hypothetical protein PF002_g16684 [Phytophthora fragariae]
MEAVIRDALAPTTNSHVLLKTRVGFLKSVADVVRNARDLTFLNRTRAVVNRVEDSENLRTQYSRWCHVIALVKAAGDAVTASSKRTYGRKIERLKASMQRNPVENRLTDEQQERYRSLADLEGVIADAMERLFVRYGFPLMPLTDTNLNELVAMSGKKLNATRFAKEMQRIALMACYTLQPALRADWSTLRLTSRLRSIPSEGNWLYFKKAGPLFSFRVVMQDFKNSRHMGMTTIEVKRDLAYVLSAWLRVLQRLQDRVEYLFIWCFRQNRLTHVASRNSLARRLPRIFGAYAGTPLTVNDMRHIHESDLQASAAYQRMTVRERDRAHAQLLHSHMTGIAYNRV